CTSCVRKGLECGNKIYAKEWTSRHVSQRQTTSISHIQSPPCVSRALSLPEDDQPAPFEAMHIRSIRERNFLFKFTLLQFPRRDGHHLWENLFRRFTPVLSSKSVRYGCILYSIYKHRHEFKHETILSRHND